MPLAILIFRSVAVILSAKFYRETGEGNSISFLSVALGLFDFPNQT